MFIRQISVLIQNRSGALAEVLQLLSNSRINIRAFSLADTSDFGILRMIVDDPDRTQSILKAHNIASSINRVLGVRMADAPGSLYAVLLLLSANGISVEYSYAFASRKEGDAYVILRTDDREKAAEIFKNHAYGMLSEEDLENE